MAGVESVLCSKKTIDKGVLIKICPITSGCPTKMSKDEAVRRCTANQKMAAEPARKRIAGGTRYSLRPGKWCLVCQGKQWPDELEIIDSTEVEGMATQRHKGTCDGCGTAGVVVGKNYKKMMCTVCNTAYASVNNRLPVVAAAVVELGKVSEFMGLVGSSLPEQVGDAVESVVLARIAKAVGYDGKDADGLVAAVEQIAAAREELSGKLTPTLEQNERMLDGLATTTIDRDRAINLLRSANAAMPDGEVEYEQLPERIARLAADYNALLVESRAYGEPAPDVIRALGMPDGSTVSQVWEAAIQTCAQLEALERVVFSVDQVVDEPSITASEWHHICRALFGDQAAHMQFEEDEECTSMAILQTCAQLEATERELHSCMDASLDSMLTLTNLRMALGVEDEQVDLVSPVAELAQGFDRYKEHAEQLAAENSSLAGRISDLETGGGASQQGTLYTLPPCGKTIDGHLLDLALAILRGEVSGILPEWISTLREAA